MIRNVFFSDIPLGLSGVKRQKYLSELKSKVPTLRIQHLEQELHVNNSLYEIVDTVPVPAATVAQSKTGRAHWFQTADVGYGGNQDRRYWGYQALISIQPTGAISGFILVPASSDDRWLMQGLLSQRS